MSTFHERAPPQPLTLTLTCTCAQGCVKQLINVLCEYIATCFRYLPHRDGLLLLPAPILEAIIKSQSLDTADEGEMAVVRLLVDWAKHAPRRAQIAVEAEQRSKGSPGMQCDSQTAMASSQDPGREDGRGAGTVSAEQNQMPQGTDRPEQGLEGHGEQVGGQDTGQGPEAGDVGLPQRDSPASCAAESPLRGAVGGAMWRGEEFCSLVRCVRLPFIRAEDWQRNREAFVLLNRCPLFRTLFVEAAEVQSGKRKREPWKDEGRSCKRVHYTDVHETTDPLNFMFDMLESYSADVSERAL